MAVVRYAVSGLFRNRRRTFSSIIGVFLAVTFIAGSFIAIDSSARSALDAILANVPGDLGFTAPARTGDNGTVYMNALEALSAVKDVSIYRSVSLYFSATGSAAPGPYGGNTYGNLEGIRPDRLPAEYRDIPISGSLSLPNGTIAISDSLAGQLALKLGDRMNVSYQSYIGNGSMETSIVLNVSAIFTPQAPVYGPGYYPGPYYGTTALVNLRFFSQVLGWLGLSESYAQVQGEIWIDRAAYINPYDTAGTTANVVRLQRQFTSVLIQAGAPNPIVSENITGPLGNFASQMTFQRLLYLLLSAPVILVGLYLGAVGVDLGHAERRRELGVLKTRGASRGQIASLLILESILSGLVAAAIGLAAGVALSRFLLSYVNPFGTTFVPAFGDIFLSSDTVITVCVLSILFMGAVSYRSARRTAGIPVVEGLRYYAPGEMRLKYSPTGDIVLVAYGVASYVGSSLLRSSQPSLFTFLFLLILTVSLPIVPLLLIVGVTRLATRATGRIYGGIARVCRPFAKNLEYMISRNLTRNPRRASSVAIIIALGLGFGLFVVSALSSQQAYTDRVIRASVGGDMSVSPPYPRAFNATGRPVVDPGFATNLSNVPGVAAISRMDSVPNAQPSIIAGPSLYGSVYALDPATYFSVVHPESFFYEPSSESEVESALTTPNMVVITAGYADAAALRVGDILPINGQFYANLSYVPVTVQATVGAVVRFLPGVTSGYGAPTVIYGSFATFAPFFAANNASNSYTFDTERYFVDLAPGADWKTVKADVTGIGATSVVVYQEEIDRALSNPFTGSILGFMEMEIAFIVVILTVGLALIIYAASLERDVEFAGIIARGASGWQTAGILVGEAFSIMLIGLIVGASVGLVTSYFFVQFIFFMGTGTGTLAVPYLFTFPLEGLLLLVLAPAAMLGGALVVSWRTARMNVARVLKMRGG